MSAPVPVLIHSPLVGPLTWRAVVAQLAETHGQVVMPDLTGVFAGRPPYQPAIAEVVAANLVAVDPGKNIVLVGHSGAGPLLPRIAQAVSHRVSALIYVDSLLPYPGESWLAHAPQPLVEHLGRLVCDGLLPPWHEWFPPETITELLPDPRLRAAFVRDLPRLPFAYFQEPNSADVWRGLAGYLLLSDGYQADAGKARQAGMPVVEQIDHHLAMLTSPADVTTALRRLILATAPL
ncbi:MAG TPA: hypothetical protein VFX61_03695 [Micromonosporaceae bacterium]|nr:hypothetical protein [Micromonosporaceae bacterium]